MFKIKKITVIILIFCFSLSFFGCRKKYDPNDTPEKTTPTPNLTKEIVFWNLYDNSDIFKGQIQAFESSHPGVHIKYKKFVNIEEYWDTILNELAEGEGPDIFAINNNWILKHHKKFYPMPDGTLDIPMNAEIFKQTFFNVAATDLIMDNHVMGIPLFIDTLALYYNKNLFIDNIANSDEPADTWEEIKEQVYTLTKPDKSPERFGLSGIAMGRSDNIIRVNDILYLLMVQHETQFYNDEKTKAMFAAQQGMVEGVGKAYFPGYEALRLYTSFGIPSYKNYSWNELMTGMAPTEKEINPFARGKVAMIFGYSFLYDQITDAISGLVKTGNKHISKNDIGIAPIPQLYEYKETGKQDAYTNYFPLVVSRNTEYPEEAWNFLLYLSSKNSLETYHEKTNKPTSRKDMIDEQSLEPLWGVFARQASYAKSYSLYDLEKFNEYFSKAIDSVVKNKKTVENAMDLNQKKVNCILDKRQPNANRDVDCDKII